MKVKTSTCTFIIVLISIMTISCTNSKNGKNKQLVTEKTAEKEIEVIKRCDKEVITLDNNFKCPFWSNEKFTGTFCRTVAKDGSKLVVEMDTEDGGTDTALDYMFNEKIFVDDIPADATVSSKVKVDIDLEKGLWWVGPKLDIRKAWNPREGWQETYVVENASISPEDFNARRMKMIEKKGGKFLGTTTHDGATYNHYTNNHNEWKQYWAIRQEWRESGEVSINPIIKKWRQSGMPNYYLKNVRINIEFNGKMKGTTTMTDVSFKSL